MVRIAATSATVAAAVAVGVLVVSFLLPARHASKAHKIEHSARAVTLAPPGPIPGYLLIADRGNNRMLLVDSKKQILWRYPKPGVKPSMPFRFDDDAFFGPRVDRIISNQEDQHTIQVISFPRGRLLWRYGRVDIPSSRPGFLHTPDDAYLLRNGIVTVADAYDCRVLFISPAHRIVRQYGTSRSCRHDPPRELGPVNGATPLSDGGTLVSEINGSWVDDIGPNGRLRWAVQAPVSYPSDPQLLARNRILIADYARPGHVLVMTRTGRVLWRYGPASGPGELDHPSLATRIAPGLIAVNDDYRQRVVVIRMRTNRIVWQYGHTDVVGRRPGYLNTPDGLALLRTASAQRRPVIRSLLSPRRVAPAVAFGTRRKPAITIRLLSYRLSAPVQREVAIAAGGRVLIAGGLDTADRSTSGVFRLDPSSGRLTLLGSVPRAFHDAAGGLIGGRLFIFGGGAAQGTATVQVFDPRTRRGAIVSQLPRALSDLSAARLGRTLYLVGGYDGRIPRGEVYGTTDGRHFFLAARLPIALRYPAVAAVGASLIIAGGVSSSGTSAAVYAFDPAGVARVRLIGQLPRPVAHASAVTLGRTVYVIGGVDAHGRTVESVTAIDAGRGPIEPVAAVARVSDAAVLALGARALIVGGAANGKAVATVREVRH